MTDRLYDIRSDFIAGDLAEKDIEWLIAEVFRLRDELEFAENRAPVVRGPTP